jgi:competence protein ComEA
VNLASPVIDGALLVVPRLADAPQHEAAEGLQGAASPPSEAGQTAPALPRDGQAAFQSDTGLVVLQPGQASGAPLPGSGSENKLNINTASAAQLEALPGIGPALAARIVAHRESNGPFLATEDLMAVSGIGQAILEKIADLVRAR